MRKTKEQVQRIHLLKGGDPKQIKLLLKMAETKTQREMCLELNVTEPTLRKLLASARGA